MAGIPRAKRHTHTDRWLVLNGVWHWTVRLSTDTAFARGATHMFTTEGGRVYQAIDLGGEPAGDAEVCPECRSAFQQAAGVPQ